jgi:hypothetical protein
MAFPEIRKLIRSISNSGDRMMDCFIKKLWSVKSIIVIAVIFFTISFVCSFFHHFNCLANTPPFLCWKSIPFLLYLNKGQLVTYGMGLLAVIVVYSQLISLRDQLQLQALMEYSKQWNSQEMKDKRKTAMNILKLKPVPQDVNIDPLEQVLELLEDFSSLANKKIIDQKLVWKSSLGWYASRYFYYSRENGSIEMIRSKWCSESQKDNTYYEELESLYDQYLDNEVNNVMKDKTNTSFGKRKKIVRAYRDTKDKFIQTEFGFTNDK